MGQTIPEKLLRCVLECRDMVSVQTADGEFPVIDGDISVPEEPGLGGERGEDVVAKFRAG